MTSQKTLTGGVASEGPGMLLHVNPIPLVLCTPLRSAVPQVLILFCDSPASLASSFDFSPAVSSPSPRALVPAPLSPPIQSLPVLPLALPPIETVTATGQRSKKNHVFPLTLFSIVDNFLIIHQ